MSYCVFCGRERKGFALIAIGNSMAISHPKRPTRSVVDMHRAARRPAP